MIENILTQRVKLENPLQKLICHGFCRSKIFLKGLDNIYILASFETFGLEADNMATREENIKKINAKLDAMSDEELDRVAGAGIDPAPIGNPNPNPNLEPVPGFDLKR